MLLLAWDHALNHSGYSIWEDKKLILADNFISTLKVGDNSYNRLKEVYDFFKKIIVEYNPTHMVMEQMWVGHNVESFKNLVMLNALLIQLSWEHNILVKEINIRKYRNFFGIKDKKEVKTYIEKCYPEIKVDKKLDISDSLLLGKYIVEKNYELDKC